MMTLTQILLRFAMETEALFDEPGSSIAEGVPARVLRPLDRTGVERLWSWAAPHEPAREKPQP